MREGPLVSIMIPNYNHSKYLPDCLKSVQNQTYKNLEAVVLDNQSEDDSVAVATQYIGERIRVCRNAFNIYNGSYKILSGPLTHGDYMMLLCADDYIHPEFVERAVAIMEKHPNVGYVHGERDFVTPDGQVIELDPFYRCSFTAPGKNDTPVYMVTSVAYPSQGIFRRYAFQKITGYEKVTDYLNADRLLWFYLSQESDYAYIRDKMCSIRVGQQTESFAALENFQHALYMYMTIKEFVDYGKKHQLENVVRREGEALHRLAVDLLEYAEVTAANGNWEKAIAYLKFCYVVSRDIEENEDYKLLIPMVREKRVDASLLNRIKGTLQTKKRGYEPPIGYVEL